MALQKLQFKPGIVRDTTDYTNEGGWFDCDKVRFRMGLPETIGAGLSSHHQQCLAHAALSMFGVPLLVQIM
jgi:hypothetical protein